MILQIGALELAAKSKNSKALRMAQRGQEQHVQALATSAQHSRSFAGGLAVAKDATVPEPSPPGTRF